MELEVKERKKKKRAKGHWGDAQEMNLEVIDQRATYAVSKAVKDWLLEFHIVEQTTVWRMGDIEPESKKKRGRKQSPKKKTPRLDTDVVLPPPEESANILFSSVMFPWSPLRLEPPVSPTKQSPAQRALKTRKPRSSKLINPTAAREPDKEPSPSPPPARTSQYNRPIRSPKRH